MDNKQFASVFNVAAHVVADVTLLHVLVISARMARTNDSVTQSALNPAIPLVTGETPSSSKYINY